MATHLNIEALDPNLSLKENVAQELAALYARAYQRTGTRPLPTEHEVVERPDWIVVPHNSFTRFDPRQFEQPKPDQPS